MGKNLNPFETVIKNYLDDRARTDEQFAASYAKENKSFEECINYIYQTVRKANRIGFENDEIYGMAVHYYDEDNIEIEKNAVKPAKVVSDTFVGMEEQQDATTEPTSEPAEEPQPKPKRGRAKKAAKQPKQEVEQPEEAPEEVEPQTPDEVSDLPDDLEIPLF